MVDTNALKGIIVANGLTMCKVADEIGMAHKTFYTKMKKGVFGSDEMEKMIVLLKMENPMPVFFPRKVTCEVTHNEGNN